MSKLGATAVIWLGPTGIRHVYEAQLAQSLFDWQLVKSEIKTCTNMCGIQIDYGGLSLKSFKELYHLFDKESLWL